MNYGDLKAAILNYIQINDVDFTAALPLIVARTQERLRNLRIIEKEKHYFALGPEIELPADLEEVKEIWTQSQRNPTSGVYDEDYPKSVFGHLRPVSWQQMTQWLELDSGGRPQYFARVRGDDGKNLIRIFPNGTQIDGGQWSVEITYWHKPENLVNDSDTNVYTDNFSDLLIYGSVAEGYRWLRTEDKMIIWEQMFQALYDEIAESAKLKDYRGSTLATSSPYTTDMGRASGNGW